MHDYNPPREETRLWKIPWSQGTSSFGDLLVIAPTRDAAVQKARAWLARPPLLLDTLTPPGAAAMEWDAMHEVTDGVYLLRFSD